METITNAASTITSTVSKTIFGEGEQGKETAKNETAGSEPVSGVQGKGTATEPYDQGNNEESDPTKTTPENTTSTTESVTRGLMADTGAATITSTQPETKTQVADVPSAIPSAAETSAPVDKKTETPAAPENPESKAANPSGDEPSKEKGTGEIDATKPADRLLEQKSVQKSEPSQASTQPTATSSKDTKTSGDKQKVSLSEKIKNKLHIGRKDKK